jgi:hypothetical protein
MYLTGNNLYIGGDFTQIGTTTRNHIAALDASAGVPIAAFNPDANSTVQTLAFAANQLYIGGSFTTIGGQSRRYLASLDLTTGNATAFDPNMNSYVYQLSIDENILYAVGGFNMVSNNSISRRYAAAYYTATNTLTPWDPSLSNAAYNVYGTNGLIFMGGNFASASGQTVANCAAINHYNVSIAWYPTFVGYPEAFILTDSTLFTGGSFYTYNGAPVNYMLKLKFRRNEVVIGTKPEITSGKTVMLFPVPSKGAVTVRSKQTIGSPITWAVYNVQGKLVETGSAQQEGTINASGTLPAGIYMVQTVVGGVTESHRIVLE